MPGSAPARHPSGQIIEGFNDPKFHSFWQKQHNAVFGQNSASAEAQSPSEPAAQQVTRDPLLEAIPAAVAKTLPAPLMPAVLPLSQAMPTPTSSGQGYHTQEYRDALEQQQQAQQQGYYTQEYLLQTGGPSGQYGQTGPAAAADTPPVAQQAPSGNEAHGSGTLGYHQTGAAAEQCDPMPELQLER